MDNCTEYTARASGFFDAFAGNYTVQFCLTLYIRFPISLAQQCNRLYSDARKLK